MQKRYSEEFKEAIIKKMMPPQLVSVSKLSRDTGVSDVTLYKWRKNYPEKPDRKRLPSKRRWFQISFGSGIN